MSMQSCAPSSSSTRSRPVTSDIASCGRCCCASASRSTRTSTVAVRSTSLPGFRMTALPLLSASAAICVTASGRASKIAASTPSGTLIFCRYSPCSALVVPAASLSSSSTASSVRPSGSGNNATARTCSTISRNLAAFSINRAIVAGASRSAALRNSAARTSSALAASNSALAASRATAMASNAALRVASSSDASRRDASFAACAIACVVTMLSGAGIIAALIAAPPAAREQSAYPEPRPRQFAPAPAACVRWR